MGSGISKKLKYNLINKILSPDSTKLGSGISNIKRVILNEKNTNG